MSHDFYKVFDGDKGHYEEDPAVMDNLKLAFSILSSKGFLIGMNHLCCASCAGYDLAEQATRIVDEGGAKPNGVVFWHNQDQDNWRDSGSMSIRYGQIGTQKYGDLGLDTLAVGQIVVAVLDECSVPWSWDGDPGRTITVYGRQVS